MADNSIQLKRNEVVGFSFTRVNADEAVVRQELSDCLDIIIAWAEIDQALEEATRALGHGDENAFAEQQRLHGLKAEMNERLASLAIGD